MTAVDTLAAEVPAPPRAWLDGVNPVTKIVLALLLSVPLFASIDATSALVAHSSSPASR